MEGPMKNIPKGEMVDLRDLVPYQEGQVVSRTLAQNPHVSLTLFAFEKGEEISTHASGGDALVTVLASLYSREELYRLCASLFGEGEQ